MDDYGATFTLDGVALDTTRDLALVAATASPRWSRPSSTGMYVDEVWAMPTPTARPLLLRHPRPDALLILSGQYIIW